MNKREVIEKLKNELDYSEKQCVIINNIVEDTFLIGKKNKEKMTERFVNELNVSKEEANRIYEVFMSIFGACIKDKLKHPFKDLDK